MAASLAAGALVVCVILVLVAISMRVGAMPYPPAAPTLSMSKIATSKFATPLAAPKLRSSATRDL
jgi:hypothetical protein